MGKRAASRSSTGGAKATRKADEDEHLAPVQELLASANLSESCRDMLSSMLPHALNAPKDDRHPYQAKMVDVLSSVVSSIEAEHVATVAAAETDVQEAVQVTEAATKDVTEATDAKDAAEQDRSAKDTSLQEAQKHQADAEEALAAATKSVTNLDVERTEFMEEKAEYERAVEETWTPLREATIPGQKWRERAKMITSIIEMMEKVGVDASLAGGLPPALKTKKDDRGPFANTCIECGENLLKGHIAKLAEKLGNMDAEGEARAKAVTDAESALSEAKALRENCQLELKSSEGLLAEKNAMLKSAAKSLKDAEKKQKHLEVALEKVKKAQEEAKSLANSFEAVKDGPKPPEDVPMEAAAEEAAPAPEAAETAPAEVAA